MLKRIRLLALSIPTSTCSWDSQMGRVLAPSRKTMAVATDVDFATRPFSHRIEPPCLSLLAY